MIKRDFLQLVAAAPESDKQGGHQHDYQPVRQIPAHVSISTSLADITQYGIKDEMVLHTVTSEKLADGASIRYKYRSKLFKLLRQVQNGNEWFQVFKQVYN